MRAGDLERYPLIPWPRVLEPRAGELRVGDPDAALGAGGPILRTLDDGIRGDEEYSLDVTPDRAELRARTERGSFDVVMCPQEDLYFDHYQADPEAEPLAIGEFTSLEDTYGYEPVPAELTPEEGAHVIGAQGCVWTEYMPSPDHVEYMTYPRSLALAELAWSPREVRDLDSFRARLGPALARLDPLGVRYRPPGEVR